jgi:hypothetical protein
MPSCTTYAIETLDSRCGICDAHKRPNLGLKQRVLTAARRCLSDQFLQLSGTKRGYTLLDETLQCRATGLALGESGIEGDSGSAIRIAQPCAKIVNQTIDPLKDFLNWCSGLLRVPGMLYPQLNGVSDVFRPILVVLINLL